MEVKLPAFLTKINEKPDNKPIDQQNQPTDRDERTAHRDML